jgi:hypothetical protein
MLANPKKQDEKAAEQSELRQNIEQLVVIDAVQIDDKGTDNIKVETAKLNMNQKPKDEMETETAAPGNEHPAKSKEGQTFYNALKGMFSNAMEFLFGRKEKR